MIFEKRKSLRQQLPEHTEWLLLQTSLMGTEGNWMFDSEFHSVYFDANIFGTLKQTFEQNIKSHSCAVEYVEWQTWL